MHRLLLLLLLASPLTAAPTNTNRVAVARPAQPQAIDGIKKQLVILRKQQADLVAAQKARERLLGLQHASGVRVDFNKDPELKKIVAGIHALNRSIGYWQWQEERIKQASPRR